MEIVSYPNLVMASVVFYVGVHHLLMFAGRPESKEQLSFALICFSVGFYNVFCIGLYNSQTLTEGIGWQRMQLIAVHAISVFLSWFVHQFTGQKSNRVLVLILAWFGLLLLALFIADDELTLSLAHPAVKTIVLSPDWTITYNEVELGPIVLTGVVSSVAVYGYLLVLLMNHYRRVKDSNTLFMIAAQLTYFGGVVHDSLVGAGIHVFPYLSEYAFLIIVASMSYILMNEFVSLHHKIEHMNHNLEAIVAERTREIQSLNESLKQQIDVDGLTGIYNRRFFNEYLEIETRRAKSSIEHSTSRRPTANDMNFGLAMLDVDDFKQINDVYGHLVGDKVLIELVDTIKGQIFTRDIFCRYGGEEFVIIFTRASSEGIVHAVKKVHTAIANHGIQFEDSGPPHFITISVGVVLFDEAPHMTGREILKIADDRLYRAKKDGKNRISYRA